MEKILRVVKKILPKKFFGFFQPAYHWLLALAGAIAYRFPSRKIFVIGITGTKGKTSTAEIISAILEEAGYKTALSSSLRFKIGKESEKNKYKMTMPGRIFMQKFLRKAVDTKCDYTIIEVTSEGIRQHRHKFINFNALVFTNLHPEHIESHGSFENYREEKMKLFIDLKKSKKHPTAIIINEDDENADYFYRFPADIKIRYGLKNLSSYFLDRDEIIFTTNGIEIKSKLSGLFNLYNLLAGIAFAKTQKIKLETAKSAIEKFSGIEGRMEFIDERQNFKVLVDYAHTPDSLEKVYETFQGSKKICVLGSAGGGRDKWKRPEMGKIASKHCEHIILTNEDPYDENPQKIIKDIAMGIDNEYETILDRREAISRAISMAKDGDTVIITGKGSEPWMMLANGKKIKWDDRKIAREEIKKLK